MIKGLYILLIAVLLGSCDSNRLYEKNISIDNDMWSLEQMPNFEFENTDTISEVNLILNIRHSSIYPFSNLWVFIHILSPSGATQVDTLETTLSQKDGKWLGDGLGDIWDLQVLFKKVRLNESGTYSFKIEQAMRHGNLSKIEQLPGVMEIGLRIENIE
ncbi:MAG: gliding motility lipoprotein GldH [Flavobacteriales bacterium]|jgi:gliding motility-associated lipoprotein GldH|nr:gliding motility lipoprotein GldH [Flavobacteriales bacterium]MDG1189663.1 gliding motility lipoprotein GldH [Flavobacteriales bacterium]